MMTKHHILHIRDSSDIYGGERVILTLGKNMNRRGLFDVSLLCMRRPDGRSEALISLASRLGIPVQPVDVSGRFDPAAILRIRSYIRKNKVSLIHTHDFKSDFYGLWATLNFSVKRVATAHGSTRDSLLKRLYLFLDEKFAYRSFDKIIAVSKNLKSHLINNHIPRYKITVIQNGLDLDLLKFNEGKEEPPLPLSKKPGTKIFAVIGRLYPDKGHLLFLQSFSNLTKFYPKAIGLIIGNGPERETIVNHIKSFHLEEKVYYCGARKNIKVVYDTIDYLVIPSYREGLPYVLLEAMACGIPVIATAVGDIPLLIQHGVTGYLVSPGDIEGLTRHMMECLSVSERARRMANEAKTVVQEKYSAERMVEQTENLYKSLLS